MGLLSTLGGIAGSVFGGPVGGAIGSALGGAFDSRKSVGDASQAQQQAAQGGIDEQRRQFDAIQKLLNPYVEAGTSALGGQQALLGLGTPGSQQQAIAALQSSPQFQALQQQGENAILQNASATGGLRGGNVQAALAQFRPALLSGLIDQQYSRLGGLTSIGQNAAAGVGNAGMSTGANISNLLGRQGQAQAGGILGQQGALSGGISQAFGAIQGAGGFGQLFGRTPAPAFNAPGQGFFSGAQSGDVGF
jgi:hypothetical protein